MKPFLFLDVDGVLNCHAYVNIENFDELTVIDNSGQPEHVVVPKYTKQRIGWLSKYFDIVWATAWVGAAHTAFKEHLDLPVDSWPHLDWDRLKIVEILKYAGDRAWAWVDDIAAWELQQMGWNNHDDWDDHGIHKRPNRYFQDNTLIIAPSGKYGLTDSHVYELIRFAKQWS